MARFNSEISSSSPSPTSFSSSSSISRGKYDVFLSSRGEDTRKNFTDHLYEALKRRGIITFRDDEKLESGEAIAPELFKAIRESWCFVIVLSDGYAFSSWCLEELSEIIQQKNMGHKVFPIFYDVDPSNLRKQTGKVQDAFAKHEENFNHDKEKTQSWRSALTEVANIKGWHLNNRHESELSGEIIKSVSTKLCQTFASAPNDMIGVQSRLEKLRCKIDIRDEDDLVRIIGICGMGGLGSRIIITTRDEHVLQTYGVDDVYEPEKLNAEEALRAFSLKAFRSDTPAEDFVELSEHVVEYANGLPLALEVFGSFLSGRSDAAQWRSAIERLEKESYKEIHDRLQISFDVLEETERDMFLDIACFFKGDDRDAVTKILDGCGFFADIGLDILIKKSLITINEDNKLWMHDLLQQMGRKIVGQKHPDEPGMRSRLWDGKDTYHVLSANTATEAIQGIAMDHIGEQNKTLSADAFLKMKKLRLLRFFNAPNSQDITYLSKELRLLEWHRYPFKSFPPSFEPENLVALRLPYSRIENLWKPNVPLHRLKLVDLKGSENLVNTPDFSMATNLESLDLEGTGISRFHPTIKFLRRLKLLNLRNCKHLGSFPSKIGKESLETLILSGCSNIERIPEFVGEMECLKELCLDGTCIKQLPSSIGHLRSLELLTLEGCSKLECLPSSIGGCEFLENLNLCGCSKLQNLPENLLQIKSLETLDLSKTAITTPPPFIFHMKNLKLLSFRGCKGPPSISWATQRLSPNSMTLRLPVILSGLRTLKRLYLDDCNLHDGAIPSDICSLSSLQILYLSGNNFTTLPRTLGRLSKLTLLALTDCERLKSLPELPAGIQLWIDGCASLDVIAGSTTASNSRFDYGYICAFNCFKLAEAYNAATMLKRHLKVAAKVRRRGYDIVTPGSEIPYWFINQTDDYSNSRIKIQLPPNFLNDSQIVGFAFCCVFFSDFNNNGWRGDCISFRYGIRCRNYSREVGDESFNVAGGSTRLTEDHLWLHYLPRHKVESDCEEAEIYRSGRDMSKARFEMEVVFEIFGFHSMVKKCGVRVVYRNDLEEMDEAIDEHCRPNECDIDMDPALHRKNDPVDSFRGKRKQAALSRGRWSLWHGRGQELLYMRLPLLRPILRVTPLPKVLKDPPDLSLQTYSV